MSGFGGNDALVRDPSVGASADRQRKIVIALGVIAMIAGAVALWATWMLRSLPPIATTGPGIDGPLIVQPAASEGGLSGWVADPPATAPDFTLTATDGTQFTLSHQAGQVVLVFFGYTNCPDVCPETLTWLGQGLEKLEDETANVKVVFVSIDPERDTPDVIESYVGTYDPRITGVTGSIAELEKVVASYSSSFFKQVEEHEHAPGTPTEHAHDDYTMAHPSEVYVIDPAGQLREFMSLPFSPDDVVNDVTLLLGE